MTDTDAAARWQPASGSVARHAWSVPARWAWWLLHRSTLTLTLTTTVVLGWRSGPVVLTVGLVIAAVALMVWRRAHPRSFEPTAGRALLGVWRSGWAYGVRWRAAMMLSGLGGRFDGDEYLPRVVRVRAGRWSDHIVVRMVAGQQPLDWARRSDALAHAFGARCCQTTALAGRPGYLELTVGRADPLVRIVAPPDPKATVDLDAVSVGAREDGQPWRLQVGGSHVLVAGCTGAGKGSVLWSLIHGLAPAVHAGVVELWVCDPRRAWNSPPGRLCSPASPTPPPAWSS